MMLDLDALAVESFETDAPQGRGTVVGAAKAPAGGTYPYCSEIDACPSAWHCSDLGTCLRENRNEDTMDLSCGGHLRPQHRVRRLLRPHLLT